MNVANLIRSEKIQEAGQKMIEVMHEVGLNAIESSICIGGLKESNDMAAAEFVKLFPEDMREEMLKLMTT